jgi:hypothetical protein
MFETEHCGHLRGQLQELEKFLLAQRRRFWLDYPESKFRGRVEVGDDLTDIRTFPPGSEGVNLRGIIAIQRTLKQTRELYEADCKKRDTPSA